MVFIVLPKPILDKYIQQVNRINYEGSYMRKHRFDDNLDQKIS